MTSYPGSVRCPENCTAMHGSVVRSFIRFIKSGLGNLSIYFDLSCRSRCNNLYRHGQNRLWFSNEWTKEQTHEQRQQTLRHSRRFEVTYIWTAISQVQRRSIMMFSWFNLLIIVCWVWEESDDYYLIGISRFWIFMERGRWADNLSVVDEVMRSVWPSSVWPYGLRPHCSGHELVDDDASCHHQGCVVPSSDPVSLVFSSTQHPSRSTMIRRTGVAMSKGKINISLEHMKVAARVSIKW